jgi:hypothetical protein
VRSSAAEAKPLARGLSGAVERSKLIMKKSVQGVGTLVSTTVAKTKSEDQDGDLDGVKKCGWLVKKGQKRWFALKDGSLMWFKEAQNSANAVTKENSAGCLVLKEGCLVRRVQDKAALVVVTQTGKPYELVAYDNATRDVWLTYLTEACGGVRARAPTIKTAPQQKLKGWLKRKAGPGKLKPWKKIYVKQQDSELFFFDSDDTAEKESSGSVNLLEISNVEVTYEDGVSATFEVHTTQTVFYFMAMSEEDLAYWTTGLAPFWEQRKGGKASGPPKPAGTAKKPQLGDGEVRVSETLIVKGAMGDADDNEEHRQKVLDALEDSSSEDGHRDVTSPVAAPKRGAGNEPDADFDSLMDALGSEKTKLSIRTSESKTKQQKPQAGEEGDEEAMNEMFTDSQERVQHARKPTVIRTESSSTEFSASGRLMRKSDEPAERTRSRTEIQRRMEQKEKERSLGASASGKMTLEGPKGGSGPRPVGPKGRNADLDELSAILAEEDTPSNSVGVSLSSILADDDSVMGAGKKGKPPQQGPQPKLVMQRTTQDDSDGFDSPEVKKANVSVREINDDDFDDFDDFDEPPKQALSASTKKVELQASQKNVALQTSQKAVVADAKKLGASTGKVVAPPIEDDLDDFDEEPIATSSQKIDLKSSSQKIDAKKPAAKVAPPVDDDFDGFDVAEEPKAAASKKVDLKGSAKKIEAKKPADDFDDFDALSSIPSFDFSDEEIAPKKLEKKTEPPKAAVAKKEDSAKAIPKAVETKKEGSAKSIPKVAEPKKEDSLKTVPKVAEPVKKVEPGAAGQGPPPPRPASLPAKKGSEPVKAVPAAAVALPGKTPAKKKTKRVRKAKTKGPWVAGDRVMALFEEDDLWYKGRVAKVVKGKCHVEFLGYGNIQPCDDEMIQPIPEDELSEGDEVEVSASEEEDPEDAFNKELDSMLELPPRPLDSDEESADNGSDSDLPVPPPPPEDESDEEPPPAPVKEVKKVVPAAAPKKAEAKPQPIKANFSDEDEEPAVAKVPEKKAAVPSNKELAASQKGPDYDKCGLLEAATKGDLKLVKSILGEGKVYVDYQKRKDPKSGWTALHFAVSGGQVDVVDYLLQQGADPNLPDGAEQPPLHKAVGGKAKLAIVKRLIEAKADLMATGAGGDSVLHEARSVEGVQLILKTLPFANRKKLLAQRGQGGLTALHKAVARRDNREMCQLLVDNNPDALEDADVNGETPLFQAVRAQSLEAVALLLESGATVGARNNKDVTVFHVALAERKDFALELLMAGALVTDELVSKLLEKLEDREAEEEMEQPYDSEEEEEVGVAKQVRVAAVTRYLAVFKRAFARKTSNSFLQILATFRLGEEYLRVANYYYHSVICFNAALALCTKHSDGAGQGLRLLTQAARWQIEAVMKRARYASNNREYAKLTLATSDDYDAYQSRHYSFVGKVNIAESTEEAQEVFPPFVLDTINTLFEQDWRDE